MTPGLAAMLFAAGILAGIVNAVAGGATLFTFPTLMAAGLSPIVANASNSLAVMPGNLMAVMADRAHLPLRRPRLVPYLLVAVVGGFLGALLLLWTSERLFTKLVPALIGGATLAFAFARRLQSAIAKLGSATRSPEEHDRRLILALLVPASIYGGYFGAGLGIVLMSIFALGGLTELRRANALKNLLSVMCGIASVATFIVQGVISGPETMAMFAGAVLGGMIGGRLIRWLPASALRTIIIAVGALLSAVYAGRYWF